MPERNHTQAILNIPRFIHFTINNYHHGVVKIILLFRAKWQVLLSSLRDIDNANCTLIFKCYVTDIIWHNLGTLCVRKSFIQPSNSSAHSQPVRPPPPAHSPSRRYHSKSLWPRGRRRYIKFVYFELVFDKRKKEL